MFPPPRPTATFPYQILQKVGEGGMGEVYRAKDVDLDRQVAIKVIREEHASALRGTAAHASVQRFLQEARAAAALTHPGVTVVHRVGTEGGRPYIAMEWLDGSTLEDVLARRGRIPFAQAARLGVQVLSTLEAAHDAGVVHRDIKPANLMVLPNGRIKVTDFGIARVRGSNLAHTQAGLVMGTPQYAAPEQLAGGAVDYRADLYALACVLYEAVVGRPPFEAATLYELVHAVHGRAPTPPGEVVASIPSGFDAVILRGLAKRAEDRFASAREMRVALFAFRSPDTAPAPTPAAGPAVAPTIARVARVDGPGEREPDLVMAVVRQWASTPVSIQDRARLLQRLLDRPLHAPAFSGAFAAPGVCLLVSDGIIYRAFDPDTGRGGDDLLEALPAEIAGTLYTLPPGLDPRIVPLLASLLLPPAPRLTGLSSSFADLPQLAARLAAEGFDGALRFILGNRLGVALFSRGERILDVFVGSWPGDGPWEGWISSSGALASVEPLQIAFPAATFRQQLAEVVLEVVRPAPAAASAVRSDTRALARTIELRPAETACGQLRRAASTLQLLVDADPAYTAARWMVSELSAQFVQHGRAHAWKALIEPLAGIQQVRLHHAIGGAGQPGFDAVAYDGDGRVTHLLDRAARGTRAAVEAFATRVIAVKQGASRPGALGGAVLVAPSFDDDALQAYLGLLRSGGALRAGLDALSHRDGYVRVGMRRGFHLLLVEHAGDALRPLVIE